MCLLFCAFKFTFKKGVALFSKNSEVVVDWVAQNYWGVNMFMRLQCVPTNFTIKTNKNIDLFYIYMTLCENSCWWKHNWTMHQFQWTVKRAALIKMTKQLSVSGKWNSCLLLWIPGNIKSHNLISTQRVTVFLLLSQDDHDIDTHSSPSS